MATIAKLANGALLKIGDGASPEQFATILGGRKISFTAASFDLIDVSSHDAANNFKEYIPGMLDGGQLQISGNFRSAETSHVTLKAKNLAPPATPTNWKLFLNADATSHVASFAAYVTKLDITADEGSEQKFDATLKVIGLVSWGTT